MEGSGLEDIWASGYARNSPQMMEGKANTKTLCVFLLTYAALHCLFLQTTTADPQQGMIDVTYDEARDDLLTELIEEEGADDTRELQEACAAPNSLFSTLQKEYNDLLVNYTNMEDIKSSQSLPNLQDHVNYVKENLKLVRTGSLWLMLMQIVAIIRMFIRSECTANWHLHLKCTHDMLPYFDAACNNNYAKCCSGRFRGGPGGPGPPPLGKPKNVKVPN